MARKNTIEEIERALSNFLAEPNVHKLIEAVSEAKEAIGYEFAK
jgi:hypothetical protein